MGSSGYMQDAFGWKKKTAHGGRRLAKGSVG